MDSQDRYFLDIPAHIYFKLDGGAYRWRPPNLGGQQS